MQRKPKVPRIDDRRSGEAGLDNVEFLAEYEDIVKTFAQEKPKHTSTPANATMPGRSRDRDPVLSAFKKRKVRFAGPTKEDYRHTTQKKPTFTASRSSNASFDKIRKNRLNMAFLKEKYKIKQLKIHLDRKEVAEILQSLKKKEPPKKPVRAINDEKVTVKAEPRQVVDNHERPQITKNIVPDSPPQVKPIFYDCPSPFIKLKKEKENETVTSNKSQRKHIEVEKKLATIKKTVKKVFETSDNLKSVLKSLSTFSSPEKSAEKRKLTPESHKSPPPNLDNQRMQQEEVPVFKPTVSQFSPKEITRRLPKDIVIQKIPIRAEKSPESRRTTTSAAVNRHYSFKSSDYSSELRSSVIPKENAKFSNQKLSHKVSLEKPAAPKAKPMVDVSVQAYPSCVEADTQTCVYELTSQKVLNPALGMLPVDAILSKCERLIRIKVFDEVKNKILNMSHKYYKDPRFDNQYPHRKRSFQCDKVTALHIYSFLEEYLSKDLNECEEDGKESGGQRNQSLDMNSSKLTLNNFSLDQSGMRTLGNKTVASNGEDHTYTLPPSVVSKTGCNELKTHSFGAIKTVSSTTPLKIQMCSNISLQKASQKLKSVTNCVVRNKSSAEIEKKSNMNVKVNTVRTSGVYSISNLSIEDPAHKVSTTKLGPLPNFASIKHNRAAMSSTPEMTE